jgi:dihydrofolate reductase
VTAEPPQSAAIVLLAAVADNGVIGRDNALPFRQRSDLQRFKRISMGKPVLMGRKTYSSIGKPLPGRTNIVLTRDRAFIAPGIVVVHTLDAALEAARKDAAERGANEIIVIGGTDVFEQTLPLAERMEITHVHSQPAGDTFFPPIDWRRWREVAREEHAAGPQDDASFAYVTYARMDGGEGRKT